MKRCPTCRRTYTDPNLSFCVDDGSPLRLVDDADEPGQGSHDEWGTPAYRPPATGAPSEQPKKKLLPWALGVGVVILVLAGLGIGAAIFIPKFVREQRANREAENRQQNTNGSENQNDAGRGNTNETVNNTPAPTDKELVLAQLTQLENEWEVANINADKKKLESILADDYVGPVGDPNGAVQGKDEYIKNVRRDTRIQKWEFKDLQLTLRGERATLVGKVEFTTAEGKQLFAFTDKFVWRNGRWQATGSVVTPATAN